MARYPEVLSGVARLALAAAVLTTVTSSCRKDEPITTEVGDDFDRPEVGAGWRETGGGYRISEGELVVRGPGGHPLWLRRRLPADVMIEVDARATSDDGEIAVELFGDGQSADPGGAGCASTGYALVWRGTHAAICRENEPAGGHHMARGDWSVVGGRTHHYAIIRRGGVIDWKVDGLPMLQWTDPRPLGGAGHDHFAITGHGSEAFFDNLMIRPAPPPSP